VHDKKFDTARRWLRNLTPFGLIEWRRRRFLLGRHGLSHGRGTWEAFEACRYELWPHSLRRRDRPFVLVDVGANEGQFVNAVRRLVPLQSVYAFEPQAACKGELGRALAGIPQTSLHIAAVGGRDGETGFYVTNNSKMSSTLRPREQIAADYDAGDFGVAKGLTVPIVRLDSCVPPEVGVSLIKIDVQGAEMEVLKGGTATLRRAEAVLMEINYQDHYIGSASFHDVYMQLRGLGYRLGAVSGPYIGASGPLWADALFVNEELA